MWYGNNLPEDVFSTESHVICERLAIGTILQNTFSRYGRMGWRMYLKECLYALNEGQIETLMQPMNTNQKGDAYDLQELKWAAIKHLYRLLGEGWKKMAAQQKLAEACGVSFEAIKKWEKESIKERDKDKSTLNAIKEGAAFALFISDKNLPDVGFNRKEVLSLAMQWNISEDDPNAPPKDVSYGMVTALMLDDDYPLETLKGRLAEAGIRS